MPTNRTRVQDQIRLDWTANSMPFITEVRTIEGSDLKISILRVFCLTEKAGELELFKRPEILAEAEPDAKSDSQY